jgi:hypothetical protein
MEIIQSGIGAARPNATSVTQVTECEDREIATTPLTGERPQE